MHTHVHEFRSDPAHGYNAKGIIYAAGLAFKTNLDLKSLLVHHFDTKDYPQGCTSFLYVALLQSHVLQVGRVSKQNEVSMLCLLN